MTAQSNVLLPQEQRIVGELVDDSAYRRWLLAILLGYGLLQAVLISRWPLTFEEGINLQIGHLIGQGCAPYRQIFSLDSPLFVWFVGMLHRLGLSPGWMRIVFLGFGLLLLAISAAISRRFIGRRGALAAAFLLATSPAFLLGGGQIVAVIPALSLTSLALWLIVEPAIAAPTSRLLLSGIVWSAALFFSTLVLPVGLFALFLLARTGHQQQPGGAYRRAKNIGLWLLAMAITLLGGLWLITPDILFNHLLADYLTIYRNLGLDPASNFQSIGWLSFFSLWPVLLAIVGVVRIYGNHDHPLWLVVMWGLLAFCWLMIQPFLPETAIMTLLVPLAIAAGYGLVEAVRLARQRSGLGRSGRTVWLAVGLLLVLFGGTSVWQLYRFTLRDIETEGEYLQRQERPAIAAFIAQQIPAERCVWIDDPALAVMAGRYPAPHLVGLTRVRVLGGLVDEAALGQMMQEAGCMAAVFSKRDYRDHLPNLRAWAEGHFRDQKEFTNTNIFYNAVSP